MAKHKFIEENGIYKIESNEGNQFIELNKLYSKTILSDVDLIIIEDDLAIFMEYKNSNIKEAKNPEAFDRNIRDDKHYMKIARKYYDSLIYILNSNMKLKKKVYYYILETKTMDSVTRKLIAGKIKRKLPISMDDSEFEENLIDDFKVVSIDEWNKTFSRYKLISE